MLKAGDIQLAVALIDLPITIVRVHRRKCNTFDLFLHALSSIKVSIFRRRQLNIAVNTEDLQPFDRRWAHSDAVRHAASITQVCRGIVDNQIIRINALGHRPVTERAVVNLLKRGSTKPQHQQHAIGVRIVLRCRAGQVMVQVFFQGVGQLVLIQHRLIGIIADLYRPIGRQHLTAGVGLKAQAGLKQQWVPHLAHALDGRTVSRASKAGDLNLQAQQLDALSSLFNPFLSARQIVTDAAHELFRDHRQGAVINVINKVAEPLLGALCLRRAAVLNTLPIQRDGD